MSAMTTATAKWISIGKCAAVAVKSVKTHKVNAYMLNYMVVLPPTFNMVHITPRYGYILEKNKWSGWIVFGNTIFPIDVIYPVFKSKQLDDLIIQFLLASALQLSSNSSKHIRSMPTCWIIWLFYHLLSTWFTSHPVTVIYKKLDLRHIGVSILSR